MTAAITLPVDDSALAHLDFNVDQLDLEVADLDAQIVELVRRRSELTRQMGRSRVRTGGPRVVQHIEMSMLRRFEREFGRDGVSLGVLLLRMARTGRS